MMRAQTKLIIIGALFMILLSSIIIMAVFDDVDGPLVYEVDILPVQPMAGDHISVIIYCIDTSGVSAVQLHSTLNGEDWEIQDMTFYACLCIAGGRWVANFGPVEEGDNAKFFVRAFDDSPTQNSAETETFELTIEL